MLIDLLIYLIGQKSIVSIFSHQYSPSSKDCATSSRSVKASYGWLLRACPAQSQSQDSLALQRSAASVSLAVVLVSGVRKRAASQVLHDAKKSLQDLSAQQVAAPLPRPEAQNSGCEPIYGDR